jgi:hypothetical protein
MEQELTAVTCYYNLNNKSKYDHTTYITWMKNFLNYLNCYLVVYTDNENYELIKEFRKQHIDKTKIIIKDFNKLFMYDYTDWNKQMELDPEKNIHSKELYIIWNEKTNFIKETYKLNPFNTDWYTWLDIGSCRNRQQFGDITNEQLKYWPNQNKLNTLPKDKISFCLTNLSFYRFHFQSDNNGLTNNDLKHTHHVGGLFVLHKDFIEYFHKLYYNTMNKFIENNRFIGKDQNLLCNILIVEPIYVNLLIPDKGDPYFYIYQYLL